jgi:inositol phosphorylceramide mannosyltransferase catalytic subunit
MRCTALGDPTSWAVITTVPSAVDTSPVMAIPKILHQTWKTYDVPEEWWDCVNSWKRHHPDWEYRLWTDVEGMAFVARHYPDFLAIYQGYPYAIQRADAIRYLVLHQLGGVYADIDYECLQPLDPLLAGHSAIIGLEPAVHAVISKVDHMLCNALMATESGHPLMAAIIRHLESAIQGTVTDYDILATTGPLMLNAVHAHYSGNDLSLLPSSVLCPLCSDRKSLAAYRGSSRQALLHKAALIAQGSYAIHYWNNGWVDDQMGPLENPNPRVIDGFVFFERRDSPGNDLGYGGRNIPALAEMCLNDPRAIGFNTDGYLKSQISARIDWIRMKKGESNEGLYIKKELLSARGKAPWLSVLKRH